jgi:hypothetical protein
MNAVLLAASTLLQDQEVPEVIAQLANLHSTNQKGRSYDGFPH